MTGLRMHRWASASRDIPMGRETVVIPRYSTWNFCTSSVLGRGNSADRTELIATTRPLQDLYRGRQNKIFLLEYWYKWGSVILGQVKYNERGAASAWKKALPAWTTACRQKEKAIPDKGRWSKRITSDSTQHIAFLLLVKRTHPPHMKPLPACNVFTSGEGKTLKILVVSS